jgi:hypothetical protein
MIINQLIDEDFVNYKVPSMYIGFPKCSFKCEKECGMQVCQNGVLATSPTIDIDINTVVNRYTNNPITSAIIIAGLEPFDTFNQLINLIDEIREYTDDDIVIYTGYYKNEIEDKIDRIKIRKNIVIKFGRYIPNQQPHYDEVLGIYLASDNQYAERIS